MLFKIHIITYKFIFEYIGPNVDFFLFEDTEVATLMCFLNIYSYFLLLRPIKDRKWSKTDK